MEKKTILNSYKTFLKTCNFNLQILIQSKKENLEKNIFNLEQEKNKKKDPKEKEIFDNYIEYIKKINSEKIIIENLNEKYFKIKETLSRCGNFIYEIEKKETLDILYSFFNCRKNLNK